MSDTFSTISITLAAAPWVAYRIITIIVIAEQAPAQASYACLGSSCQRRDNVMLALIPPISHIGRCGGFKWTAISVYQIFANGALRCIA